MLATYYDQLGTTLGAALLTPTMIYVKAIRALRERMPVKAVSHITGGGFYENIPRMLPDGARAVVEKDSFNILPIFSLIQSTGGISERDMFNTFNMGIGMAVCVDAANAYAAISALSNMDVQAYIIGRVESGEKGVDIC